MGDFKEIYQTQAEKYDQMVSQEDYEGNLLPALQRLRPLQKLTAVELGAGTGRFTAMLAPIVENIIAFDMSHHMLETAVDNLQGQAPVAVADNRAIPLPSAMADLVIAGWSFAHSISWYPDSWQEEVGKMLAESKRLLKPDGTIILIETLGTGNEKPHPPTLWLAEYYKWLETVHGFNVTWIRTDYLFHSVEEGAELTRFFFGDTMADDILRQQLTILPECTGIWWL